MQINQRKTSTNKIDAVFLVLLRQKIVYPILILVNHNYEVSKRGVFGFPISYLVLEIFRVLTYVN